jgi:peptide-methionine (S)-S-oxide reductase
MSRRKLRVLAKALSSLALVAWVVGAAAAGAAGLPVAAVDAATTPSSGSETVVLAGGCFWGVQAVFEHVKGVTRVTAGYSGGAAATAHYQTVGSGTTGHAESVEVVYDPRQITLGQLLRVFFAVAHDPTQLNRQGPDVGTQYRSAIFPASTEQARVAKAYIAQLNQARVYNAAIVTKIEPDREFYAAEDYHQDYLTRYPSQPYIVYNDLPKIEDLKRLFPEVYRTDPVLVAAARPTN